MSQTAPVATATPEPIPTVEDPPEGAKAVKWQQKIGNVAYEWDGRDFFVTNSRANRLPLFRKIWQEDVAAMRKEDKKTAKTVDTYLRPVAVVGTLVSLEHEIGYLSGASAWEQQTFETRNVEKHNAIVALTDIFPEQAVFEGLLRNEIVAAEVKQAHESGKLRVEPTSLKELSAFLTAKDNSRSDAEFFLDDNYLAGFAFDRLDGNSVVVRVSLTPSSHAGQAIHGYLDVHLPVPPELDQQLRDAAAARVGFLMPQCEATVGIQYASFGP